MEIEKSTILLIRVILQCKDTNFLFKKQINFEKLLEFLLFCPFKSNSLYFTMQRYEHFLKVPNNFEKLI